MLSIAATKGPASALLVETAANLPVLSWNSPFLPFVFVLLGLKRKKKKVLGTRVCGLCASR